MSGYPLSLTRIAAWDLALCLAANRVSRRPWGWWLFATVSRLGDGVFWYALILLLPILYGPGEMRPVLHLLGVGLVSVTLYKGLKSGTTRPRPYQVEVRIQRGTAPLDQYSFPSGHTLHAVAFTMVTLNYHPDLAWIVVPFTTLVALSRIVLGLHYPSDVLAGASLGAGVVMATLPLAG
ncbi:undecaprenyl-diphosphatase [Gammaproteobacteria bacterium]